MDSWQLILILFAILLTNLHIVMVSGQVRECNSKLYDWYSVLSDRATKGD